ncbi:hypothetical protein [Chryseobacterium luquanense]|uniref:Uncharacterized protein n=1 Tax=Chryseobacterium luquanense TaxID=2983766 RepID=A0ABT3Y5N5_9FLAO|nr:hypothetical protein [Chryseobacterium luquanense]MCX8533404.1 hypothetical protein [Chryseobacterium luquanense]
MKKIFLVALFATASIARANDLKMEKNSEVKIEAKEDIKKLKSQKCYTYGIVAWCKPNEMVIDTVCYDTEVSGSYEQSRACQRENTDLYNIFMCKTRDYAGAYISIY